MSILKLILNLNAVQYRRLIFKVVCYFIIKVCQMDHKVTTVVVRLLAIVSLFVFVAFFVHNSHLTCQSHRFFTIEPHLNYFQSNHSFNFFVNTLYFQYHQIPNFHPLSYLLLLFIFSNCEGLSNLVQLLFRYFL